MHLECLHFLWASPSPTSKSWEAVSRQEIIVVDDGSEPPLQQLFQNDEKRLDQDSFHDGRNPLDPFGFFQILFVGFTKWCAKPLEKGRLEVCINGLFFVLSRNSLCYV